MSNIESKDFSKVNNLVFFEDDQFTFTKEQWNSPYILENDIPPWDKIDLPKNNKTIQMRSSSGCTFKCSFCTYPVQSKGFDAAEMDYLKAQLEIIKAQLPKPILYNCTLRRTIKKGMIKVESITPDEFLINRNAVSIDEADFVAQRVYMTRSDIILMGFDEEDVMQLPTAQTSLFDTENLVRQRQINAFPIETPTDKSTEKVEIYECYVRYDYDKDGLAELRKVLTAGVNGSFILENTPCDTMPFVSVTPIPMPHRFYGRSIAELVEDIQLMKSTVMRQLLDNMYLTNNNRVAIMDGMVNMDDLLTIRPGGVVRTKQAPNQVLQALQTQPISQQAIPIPW